MLRMQARRDGMAEKGKPVTAVDQPEQASSEYWTLLKGLSVTDNNKEFFEYFNKGKFKDISMFEWANAKDSPARKPAKIVDERQNVVIRQGPTGISALGTDDA